MPDGDHPQAVLRDAVAGRIEHAAFDGVAEPAQLGQDGLEVPLFLYIILRTFSNVHMRGLAPSRR